MSRALSEMQRAKGKIELELELRCLKVKEEECTITFPWDGGVFDAVPTEQGLGFINTNIQGAVN